MSVPSLWPFACCAAVTVDRGEFIGEDVKAAPVTDGPENECASVLLGSSGLSKAEDLNLSEFDAAQWTSTQLTDVPSEISRGAAGTGCSPTSDGTESVGITNATPSEGSELEAQLVDSEPDTRPSLTDEEQKAISALERELGIGGVQAVRGILVPSESLESCLLRFLRTNSLRAPAAAKMVRAHLAWREIERPVDLIALRPEEIAGCPEGLLERYMPTWHQGSDRLGRPVIFSHYGKFRFRPITEAGVTVDKILKLHIRNSERTARLCGEQSRKLGRDISKALIIMDTEGWDPANLRSRAAFDWVRGLAKIDQEHYPERMGQLLIINAPSSVNYFYKATSWMMPEQARNQVKIFGGREHWIPALLELIDASELPPEYGGSGQPLKF